MITVDALGEAEHEGVWRCTACTISWIDGQWCRLDWHQWIPLAELPPGPFHLIEHPDFSDYRDSMSTYRPRRAG